MTDVASQDQAFRVPWKALDAAATFGLSLFISVPVGAAVGYAAYALGLGDDVIQILLLPVSLAVLAGTVLVYVALRYRQDVWRLRGPATPRWSDAGAGLAYGILAYLAINIGLTWLLQLGLSFTGNELPTVQESFREAVLDPAQAPLFIFGAVVVAPVAEELFFRGMLFQALRDRFGLWVGAVVSALAFALAHMQADMTAGGNGLVFAVIVPLGITLAWLFDRRGTLVTPVVVHVLFNLTGVVLTMLVAS